MTARPCGACIGTGWVTAVRPHGITIIDCLACGGTGRVK